MDKTVCAASWANLGVNVLESSVARYTRGLISQPSNGRGQRRLEFASRDQPFSTNPPRHRRPSGRAIHCKNKQRRLMRGILHVTQAKTSAREKRFSHFDSEPLHQISRSLCAPRGTRFHHLVPGVLPAHTKESRSSPVPFQLSVVTRRNSLPRRSEPLSHLPRPSSGSSVGVHTSRLMNEGGHTKEGPHQIVRMGSPLSRVGPALRGSG